MRNMLALVGLAVVVFAGVGYVRGWYTFSFAAGSDGKTDFNMKVDTKRLEADAADGASKIGQAIENLKSKADTTAPTPTAAPPAAQPAAGLPAPLHGVGGK
jgi:hypothetical protein